jgi:uncharacterized protein (DUF2342 family)
MSVGVDDVDAGRAGGAADMESARSCAVRSLRGPPTRDSDRRRVEVVRERAAASIACDSWSSDVGDVDELATDERIDCGGVSEALEKRWAG